MKQLLCEALVVCLWSAGCTTSVTNVDRSRSSDDESTDFSNNDAGDETSSDEEETDTSPERILTDLDNVASVSTGMMHSCAVTTDGELWCWGNNSDGQLGDGTLTTSWVPRRVEGIPEPVVKVSAGGLHTCAVTESHALYCFGNNRLWAFGIDGDCLDSEEGACVYSTPQRIISVESSVEDVAVGFSHTCVLNTEGEVRCFGSNEYGALGHGTSGWQTSACEPTSVLNLTERVTALTAGNHHTCAALESGGVRCWGHNSSGQLGRGGSCDWDETCDTTVAGDVIDLPEKVIHLDASRLHTCAVTEIHDAVCWGDSKWGAIGTAGVDEGVPFRPSVPLENIVQVSAGETFSCARNETGDVVCWSVDNKSGQLGSSATNPPFFNLVPIESPVTSLGSGMAHSCAGTEDGRVFCWGDNEYGALGDGSGGFVMTADIPGTNATAVDTGRDYNCALGEDNLATCWGAENDTSSPITITDSVDIASEAMNLTNLVCSVSSVGGLHCLGDIQVEVWTGADDGVELFDWVSSTPSLIEGLPYNSRSVTIMDFGALVLTDSGDCYFWGYLFDGEFGVRPLSGIPAVKQVDRATMLTEEGSLLQLNVRLTPELATVAGSDALTAFAERVGDIESISDSGVVLCAVNREGEIWCTGANGHGQLGNGAVYSSGSSNDLPQSVVGLPGPMSKVSAGTMHTCALTQEGEAWCWGAGYMNRIGDNIFADHPTPVPVPGATGLVDISAGPHQTCAVKSSGEVLCWGQYGPGLGVEGLTGFSGTPVAVQIEQE